MVGVLERCVVLGELLGAPGPVTVAGLGELLPLDTEQIGRALGALESYGQVRSLIALDDGSRLFLAVEGPERAYARCRVCGAIDAVAEHPLEPMRRQLRERFGQDLRLSRFMISWICERCSTGDRWADSTWPWAASGDRDVAISATRVNEERA